MVFNLAYALVRNVDVAERKAVRAICRAEMKRWLR